MLHFFYFVPPWWSGATDLSKFGTRPCRDPAHAFIDMESLNWNVLILNLKLLHCHYSKHKKLHKELRSKPRSCSSVTHLEAVWFYLNEDSICESDVKPIFLSVLADPLFPSVVSADFCLRLGRTLTNWTVMKVALSLAYFHLKAASGAQKPPGLQKAPDGATRYAK